MIPQPRTFRSGTIPYQPLDTSLGLALLDEPLEHERPTRRIERAEQPVERTDPMECTRCLARDHLAAGWAQRRAAEAEMARALLVLSVVISTLVLLAFVAGQMMPRLLAS